MRYLYLFLVCIGMVSSPAVGQEDYFARMQKNLIALEKEILFFKEEICPTQRDVVACDSVLSFHLQEALALERECLSAEAMYLYLETYPSLAPIVLVRMRSIRERLLKLERNGRAILYIYAETKTGP